MAKNYSILVEDQKLTISFTNVVMRKLDDMELDSYPIYGTILSLGKELLALKDQEQFIILDEFQRLGVVGVKDANGMAIDIIAVTQLADVYIKSSTKVFKSN